MTKFEELLQQINRQHVYIQTHNFPDPDAIASAYGLKVLLEKKGIGATICYKGRIDDTITRRVSVIRVRSTGTVPAGCVRFSTLNC